MRFRQMGWLTIGLSLTSPSLLAANKDWPVCAAPSTPKRPILRPEGLDKMAVYLEADQALFREKGRSELQGQVYLSQQNQHIYAGRATFNKQTGDITAEEGVHLQTETAQLDSQALHYNFQTGIGQLSEVAYLLNDAQGLGTSKTFIQASKTLTRLSDATYTTCPLGNTTWQLEAKSLELDRATDKGMARQVTLSIHQQAIAYLPYFSFPLSDKRQSGFLTPNFGSDEKSGIRVSLPYYWNLAPNYDLTLTGNLLSERGLKTDAAFRYLFEGHQGNFDYEFLPNDRRYNDRTRSLFRIDHQSQVLDGDLKLQASGVSDSDYFNDFGSSLAASSTVNLERTLSYVKTQDDWTISGLVQDYQILDNSTEVYARLPQLAFSYAPETEENQLKLYASGEYTYFTKTKATNGQRIDLQAGLKKRFGNSYSYLTPALSVEHTHYQLSEGEKTHLSRTLPTASLDSGLFFERDVFKGQRLQTLEPRLYYTFTPFKDQSDIPIFDTAKRTFNYSQLFSDRLFSGKDRIADANRLSASLTTRLQLPSKGREIFRASIGQIHYFDERKVTLPSETPPSGTNSEVVMEIAGELNALTRLSGTAFLDTGSNEISASQLRLNYHDPKQRILNLGYGQRKGDYEAAHVSFASPISQNWKVVGAYERDLQTGRSLESLGGLEYQSCCWKSRLASRRYLLSDNETYDNAFFVEFELKGLGNFGSGTRNLLENRIYGYE